MFIGFICLSHVLYRFQVDLQPYLLSKYQRCVVSVWLSLLLIISYFSLASSRSKKDKRRERSRERRDFSTSRKRSRKDEDRIKIKAKPLKVIKFTLKEISSKQHSSVVWTVLISLSWSSRKLKLSHC